MPSRAPVPQKPTEVEFPRTGRYFWRPMDGMLECSPGLMQMHGRALKPVSMAEYIASAHPEDRIRIEREAKALLSGSADGYSRHFRTVGPDGQLRHILDHARIDRDAKGRAIAIHGLHIDITDLPLASMDKQPRVRHTPAYDLLRKSAERDRLEIGQQSRGLAFADIDYQAGTIALEPLASRLYGLGEGEMIVPRDAIHAMFHAEDHDALVAEIAASLDPTTGGRLETEHRIVHADGAVRWLHVRKRIDFEGGTDQRIATRGILAVLDITDQKIAEVSLRESEERLSLAQSVAGIGVWDAHLEEGRTVWSDELCVTLQLDRSTPPSPELFFSLVHPEDEPELRRAFETAVAKGTAFKA